MVVRIPGALRQVDMVRAIGPLEAAWMVDRHLQSAGKDAEGANRIRPERNLRGGMRIIGKAWMD
jgi:hypothetical protein